MSRAQTIIGLIGIGILSGCGQYQADLIPHEQMVVDVYEEYMEQQREEGNKVEWLLTPEEEVDDAVILENDDATTPFLEEVEQNSALAGTPYLRENIAAAKYCVPSDTPLIRPKYAHIPALGTLFTAYRCGPARLNELPAVHGKMYVGGSDIILHKSPSVSLLLLLDSLGFTCKHKTPAASCKQWILTDEQSVEHMMRLELFIDEIKTDTCVRCSL